MKHGSDYPLMTINTACVWIAVTWLTVLILVNLSNYGPWLDEFLGLHYISMGYEELARTLFTSRNAHFPTWFLTTKFVSSLLPEQVVPPNAFIRLPTVLLMFAVLVLGARVAVRDRSLRAVAWFLVLLNSFYVHSPMWYKFAIEGKQQGLMAVLAAVAIFFVITKHYRLAGCISLIPAMLHPFGILVSLAVTPSILLVHWLSSHRPGSFASGLDMGRAADEHWSRRFVLPIAFAAFLTHLLHMILVKFIFTHANNYSLVATAGGPPAHFDGIERVIHALPWIELFATAGVLSALIFFALLLREKDTTIKSALTGRSQELIVLAIVLLAMTIAAAMLVLKPSTPGRAHYVNWIFPAVHLCAAFAAFQAIKYGFVSISNRPAFKVSWDGVARFLGSIKLLVPLALFVSFILLSSQLRLGLSHNNGLMGAAHAVNLMVQPGDGIFGTNSPTLKAPAFYHKGLPEACPGGTMISMFLREDARRYSLCPVEDWFVQPNTWTIKPPPSIKRVIFVEEPGSYEGRWDIDLSEFTKQQETLFGNLRGTRLMIYTRHEPDSQTASDAASTPGG